MWHGGISYPNDLLSFNRFFQAFAYIWGKVAVNVFVMTSGYFLCTKDNFEIKRIIPLVAKAFSFVIIGLIIGYYVLHIEIENTQILLKNIFPVIFGKWWFFSSYIFMYLCYPYINILIKNMNIKQHKTLLILLTFILVVITTLRGAVLDHANIAANVTWFTYLYLIAAYIRIYDDAFKKINGRWLIIFILSLIGICASYVIHTLTKNYVDRVFFFDNNRPFIILLSVSLFMIFKNLNIKYSKTINVISSTTFGIYLLHDNNYLRAYIWQDIFKINTFAYSRYLILYVILVAIIMFVCCSIIDYFWQKTIGTIIYKALNKN